MHKLKLNVEELKIDGFATVSDLPARDGTVLGHDATLRCTGLCTELNSCSNPCP